MLKKLLVSTALALVFGSSAYAQLSLSGVSGTADTIGYPFTPLHLFYMSPTGSDAASGTSPGTAWATPNHAVVCGDIIIAAAGTYGRAFGTWGGVTNCPSTTGGIDGTGGIYFATVLCAGPDVVSCTTNASAGSTEHFSISTSNWAVEGFNSTPNGKLRSFEGHACSNVLHHIAFINDVSVNSQQAADTNDCGGSGAVGVDYFAAVGMIAQNAAQDTICLAAIDVVGPGVFDTNPGTHYYVYGNYSYNHTNTHCISVSDTEAYMFDTWDAHAVHSQGILANNIGFYAERMCIQLFEQNKDTSGNPTIKVYNNTCYDDNRTNGSDFADGELNFSRSGGTAFSWIISSWNNIAYQSVATGTGGVSLWAYNTDGGGINGGSVTVGSAVGVGDENVFKGSFTGSCSGATCDAGKNVRAGAGGSGPLGGNFYTNPNFSNTTDLVNNQLGAPSCTGFATTTMCMGWNPLTSTLTTPSIISDLQATCGSCGGKGYQTPSIGCAPNADYPTWLKGIVRLQWNAANSTIREMPDLVTKPCGM